MSNPSKRVITNARELLRALDEDDVGELDYEALKAINELREAFKGYDERITEFVERTQGVLNAAFDELVFEPRDGEVVVLDRPIRRIRIEVSLSGEDES